MLSFCISSSTSLSIYIFFWKGTHKYWKMVYLWLPARQITNTCNLAYTKLSVCPGITSVIKVPGNIKILVCVHVCSVIQSHLTLWNPVDCSPPGSSVHGILQARILEWVAISSSRGSFQPRDQTCISHASCIADRFFTTEPWGTTSKKSHKTGLEMILIAYYYFLKTKQKLHLH